MDVLGIGIQPASAPLYPDPPYYYRGTRMISVAYEAETTAVVPHLPPGVEPLEDPVQCVVLAVDYPFSTFGPYHEAIISARVSFAGEPYLYTPFIYVDAEAPLAAGREIWGWPKKFADIGFSFGGDGTSGFREQFMFTLDRPRGKRLLTVTMSPERPAPEDEDGVATPSLTLRQIPNCEAGKPPSISELVRTEVTSFPHLAADGSKDVWTGRASLTMDSYSTQDPIGDLAPVRILGCRYGVYDTTLPQGRAVKNYLTDNEVSSSQ